jgi:N-acetylmuramoyl-L-alanine amidase
MCRLLIKGIYIFLLSLLIVLPGFAVQDITVIYPNPVHRIDAPSTYFIGNTNPGSQFTINGRRINLHKEGIFVTMVPLSPGTNVFNLRSSRDGMVKEKTFRITSPYPEKALPAWPLQIATNTIKPDGTVIYSPGEIINVSFKGSPGRNASFSISDSIKIAMTELPPEIDTVKKLVLGEVYGMPGVPVKGYYNGIYRVKPEDDLKNAPLKIHLSDGSGTSKTVQSQTSITTWQPYKNPRVAEVTRDKATVRTGPGDARLTPLPIGTRLHLTGFESGHYRFKLAENLEGYISSNQVKLLPAGTPVPFTEIRSINLQHVYNSTLVHIPVTRKIPFLVDQSVDQSKLSITLYGAKADTDIIKYDMKDGYLDQIKWSQPANNVYVLDILFKKNQQWGYDLYYVGEAAKGTLKLIIQIKYPPRVDTENPLKDKVIAIDPGHGGWEKGAVGPGGIPEKQINLEMSKKLAKMLEDKGARPVLTRYSDVALGIYERPDFAASKKADIFLSIHNNAIPDGRDPNIEHGSSCYYYHPMAMELARSVHKQLLTQLKLPDFGLYYDNLALPREHRMPSVLIEVAFMINPQEYLLLKDPDFQEKSAKAILDGLHDFFLNTR